MKAFPSSVKLILTNEFKLSVSSFNSAVDMDAPFMCQSIFYEEENGRLGNVLIINCRR